MIDSQNQKTIVFGTLGVISSAATSNHFVDTWDANGYPFDHVKITAATAVATATNSSATWTSMVLNEATVTNVSSATAIDGGTGTTNTTATSAQFVLPKYNDTSVKQLVAFHVDLTAKERYLHLTVQASSAAYISCCFVAELSRGQIAPNTAALRGAAASVFL